MAGHLLLVILMYSFHELKAQVLLPPKLTVNPAVITETDSVTLNCQTPPSVSVTQCYFYTLNGGTTRVLSCLQTLTGTELLKMAHQRLPATVGLQCYYKAILGETNAPSKFSDTTFVTIQILLPPKLTVNPPVITETDSVTLNCQTPPSVSVTQCYFYTEGTIRVLSCLQTLTGTELLQMAHQRSPAEIKIKCYYTVKRGETNSPSPHSDTTSIMIQIAAENNERKTDLTTSISTTTSPVGGGDEGQTANRATTPVTPVKPASGQTAFRPDTTVGLISTSLSSVKTTSETVTADINLSAKGSMTTAVETPLNVTSGDNNTETWTWELLVVVIGVAGFGVTVGVISLGLALLCSQRRNDNVSCTRTQGKVTDEYVPMRNIDHVERKLPAGNAEANIMISSQPGDDCPTGSEIPSWSELENEDDTYHTYATISGEQAALDVMNMLYSTVKK
ncbi:mucin-2-like [Scomber scombrus]|uniref:mucin-2-like n=1 Tax=Scomber scombrus TaxID=13677 RepID=UPI002DDB1691|nr:mucin-2-like [Scomber scombrus]